jgi:hypothetical protein
MISVSKQHFATVLKTVVTTVASDLATVTNHPYMLFARSSKIGSRAAKVIVHKDNPYG